MLGHIDNLYYVPSMLARAVGKYANAPHYQTLLAAFWDSDAKEDGKTHRDMSHPDNANHVSGWCGDYSWSIIHRALYRHVKAEVGLT